jgi:uncharacterized protein (TIGR03492 family)
MKLLCLSNGHGEDRIAVNIVLKLQELQPRSAHLPPLQLVGLPIVGVGKAYTHADIPLLMPGQIMPSGGFIYMDHKELFRDVRQGLLPLTWQQLRTCRAWAAGGGKILAVGDIVPLLFAWLSRAPYAFVGTAKSDYYRDLRGSDYYPWEWWLMQRPHCQAVFPRDKPTSQTLQNLGIPAVDLGNPMMDEMGDPADPYRSTSSTLTLLLLPGSRPPEAYRNWQLILKGVASLITVAANVDLILFAAIDPGLELAPLVQGLATAGWVVGGEVPTWANLANLQVWQYPLAEKRGQVRLIVAPAGFKLGAQLADLAIATAGTATEQFVGLGKPVIAIPGQGPQFTRAFAQRQTRLLGESVTLVTHPEQVGQVAVEILQDPQRRLAIQVNGQARLGTAGAAERIARHLQTCWLGPT